MKNKMIDGKLVLETGEVFRGVSPSWQQGIIFGEVVFNTGMTGYEETLTDPSYVGQILAFTYPIIGNYGVSDGKNWESDKIQVQGILCQTVFNTPHHYTLDQTFLEWLKSSQIPILMGVDTREITKLIRGNGSVSGALIFGDDVEIPTVFNNNMAINWVEKVSISKPMEYGSGKYKIILVDCGMKRNILNNLLKFDVTIKVVPFDYDYNNEDYDGLFISNGPGDPELCIKTIEILKKALDKSKPTYGICLGFQLMSIAIGAKTYKLKFGHRGQNQPCIDVKTNKCYLTSQNHGYAVDEKNLPDDWEVSFRHLNDNTVSGIRHKNKPFAAVQFHPEAAAGPHDTVHFFEQFMNLLGK